MLTNRNLIREGMTVFSSDGEKLGKVFSCEASTFTIEKGFFFPKDYVARFEEVADVAGDDIRLTMTKDEFVQLRDRETYGETTREATSRSSSPDVRVPVVEEELDVLKRERETGEVRVGKNVVTETKHVEVPVTREEVHVERVPASERREALPSEKPFEKESVSVPIREEEVEIRKRPVVKEEVRVRKDRVTEQRAAEADIRKERVEIEGESGANRIRRDEEGRRTDIGEPLSGEPPRRDEE